MDPKTEQESAPATDAPQQTGEAFAPLKSSEAQPAPAEAAVDPYAQPSWSWGAFMLGPYYLIATRKYAYLWLFLLILVPIVNIVAWLGIMIFLGVKGREMAAASTMFSSREQYIGFMKGVDHAGKIMFFVTLAFIALWGCFVFFILMNLGDARDQALDAAARMDQMEGMTTEYDPAAYEMMMDEMNY